MLPLHRKLASHKGIGVDIDHTLINGPGSPLLQEWIKENHQQVELHLITFRDGKDFDLVERDITTFGITFDMFKGLHGVPAHIGPPFWAMSSRVGIRENVFRPKWLRALDYHKHTEEEYETLFQNIAMWKGAKCAELGLTALIDDLEHFVVPGCTSHGIEWINALALND